MKPKYILILLFSLASSGMSGQTLDQLLAQAIDNNLEVKALERIYAAELEQLPQVRQLPDLRLSLGAFVLPVETRLGPQWVRLGAMQSFPWMGTLNAKATLADAQAKPRLEEMKMSHLKRRYAIEQAYFDLYELEKTKAIINRNKRLFGILESLALTKITAGQGAMSEVLQLQLKIRELEQQLQVLDNQKRMPLAEINQLLGQSPATPIVIADSLLLANLPFNKDSLLVRVRTTHPQLKWYQQHQNIAQQQIRVNSLEAKPSFGVGVDYVMVAKRSDADPTGNCRDIIMPKVMLKLPLSQKKYKAKEEQQQQLILALDHRVEDTFLKMEAAIEKAYTLWQDAKLKHELYQSQIPVIQSTIRLLQADYSTEDAKFEELFRLQNELINYDLLRLKAIVQSHRALAEINQFIEKE